VPEAHVKAMLKEDAAAAASQALSAQITLCEQRLEELRTLDKLLDEQIRLSHGVAALAPEKTEQEVPADDSPVVTVSSPSYGLLGVFHKEAGELLQPGDVIVQILDDDRRSIEVEVPSWAAVGFAPGQQIRLAFPGGERRLGTLSSIPPQTSDSAADAAQDAVVKLAIEPCGKLWPSVPIGSRVLVYAPR
jgi:hypothetical protein